MSHPKPEAPIVTTVIVVPHNDPPPSWAAATDARIVSADLLARDDEGRAQLAGAGCVLVATESGRFVTVARRIHALDRSVQVIAVAPPESTAAVRRALLYAPGLGEIWVAAPSDVGAALEQRAAGITFQRRRFERTRMHMHIDTAHVSASPQRSERALISDAYLAGLLVVLPDAVFSTDASGRVLSVNVAAERLFRHRGHALEGELLSAVLGLQGDDRDSAAVLRRASGADFVDVAFQTPGGGRRAGALRAASMRVQGDVDVWAVVLRDVTEQRSAEHSFRALADAIPTLAWTARPDGYIDWYNRRWYDYTGTTPQEMAGWGWQSVHDPRVLPEVVERWSASIESGRPFEMTFPLRAADGSFRAFLTRVVPVSDSGGRIIRWFGTNTDVQAEHDSRRRVETLQALTEALAATRTLDEVSTVVVDNAVAATGAHTGMLAIRMADANEARIIRQTGLPDDVFSDFRTMPLDGATPSAECIRTGRPIFLESRGGDDGVEARFPILADLWKRLGTQSLATVPLVAGGEVVGAMSFTFGQPRTFTDEDRAFFSAVGRQCAQAVERARLFASEREARARADDANMAKSHFLATMSHELRTPLNAIGGYIQLMDMGMHGPVTEEQRTVLARVNLAQAHLLGLINDVLNFAKLESGRIEYDMRVVDVSDILGGVVPLIAPQLAEREITFGSHVATDDAGVLRTCADLDKARQIVLNLLSNATKFTEPGGDVRVDAEPMGVDRVAIRVRDTGRGIPADRVDSIFEPFVQVRAPYSAPHQGTGLGLAISRDLAQGMGGTLTVTSSEGAGSTFTLVLPRVR